MLPPPVHSVAVIVSAIIGVIIGATWYSPALFGSTWMKLAGIKLTPQQIKAAKKKGMGKSFALQFLGSLVMAFVLSALVNWVDAQTFGEGAAVAFWIWIGFILPVYLPSVLWEGKSWQLYLWTTTRATRRTAILKLRLIATCSLKKNQMKL